MTNRVGLTVLGDAGDISDALALGCSTYLLIHDGTRSVEYAHRIKEEQPEAEVLIRRYGGVSGDARDVAEQCVRVMEPYWRLGIRHIIGWNEPDRRDEGGWSVQSVADFAHTFYAYLHSMLPQARIHFPAFTNESAYQAPAQGVWIPAAQQFDDFDVHSYGRGAVARYLQWAESFLPGKPTWVTEYNYGLGNPRPMDYGNEIINTVGHALAVPQCHAVVLFTWNWPGAEPGGASLCIKDDVEARVAVWSAAQMQSLEAETEWSDTTVEHTTPINVADISYYPLTFSTQVGTEILRINADNTISSPLLDEMFALVGDIYNAITTPDGGDWIGWDATASKALRIHELINELRRGGGVG